MYYTYFLDTNNATISKYLTSRYLAGAEYADITSTCTVTFSGGTYHVPYLSIPVPVFAVAVGSRSAYQTYFVALDGDTGPDGGAASGVVSVGRPLVTQATSNPQRTVNPSALGPTGAIAATVKITPFSNVVTTSNNNCLVTPLTDENAPTGYVDLRIYFRAPSNLGEGARTPVYCAEYAAFNTVESTAFQICGYGRKRVTLSLKNTDAAKTVTAWRLTGTSHALQSAGGTVVQAIETQISPAVGASANTIAALGSASYVLAGANFDFYTLYITASASGTYVATEAVLEDA